MRISEIKGEAVIDLIADIIEPVANIATDPRIQEIIKHETVPEGTDIRALAVERLKANVPTLIKTHKADVIAILAAIEGVDAAEYKKNLNLATFIKDVTEVFADPDLIGFFTSAVPSEMTESTDSESTSTTTDTQLTLA